MSLTTYVRQTREGQATISVTHADRLLDWVYLPDIEVTLAGHREPAGRAGPVERAPDFAIEVLSPINVETRNSLKVELYMRAGTRLLWVVNPENETITAYRPGEVTTVHRAGSTIDAKPVLESFSLDVAALFDAARDS